MTRSQKSRAVTPCLRALMASVVALIVLASASTGYAAEPVTSLADGRAGTIKFWSHLSTGAGEYVFNRVNFEKSKSPLIGELQFPKGAGPFPVMIISHGSSGLVGGFYRKWAEFIREQGVATFTLNHFATRGVKETATDQGRVSEWTMATDILYAAKLLATHPKIDATKIGVIGYSKGGTATLYSHFEEIQKAILGDKVKLALRVAMYPSCNIYYKTLTPVKEPTYLLLGALDDYTPAERCEQVAKQSDAKGDNLKPVVFANAYHGFDGEDRVHFDPRRENWARCYRDFDVNTRTMIRLDTNTVMKLDNRGRDKSFETACIHKGAHIGGNPTARREAMARVQHILAETLHPAK